MLFPTPSNANFEFNTKNLTQKSYTITKALLITHQVKFIDKRKFANVTLNENLKTFIYVSDLKTIEKLIYLSQIYLDSCFVIR